MKKITLIIFIAFASVTLVNAQKIDRSKVPVAGPAPTVQVGKYESFELENGLKVFVVENHKLPKVAYSLVFDYEPVLEGENAGFVEITGDLLRTGTKSKTKDMLDNEIDYIGASINTSASGINAHCLKKHNENLLALISDILINADFKKEELDKIRTNKLSGLQQANNDPASISSRVSSAVLYGKNHPYGESETEASLNKVTVEMCNNFYKTYFKPNISYLAVVGDVTMEEVKPLIQKYFGSWQKADVPAAKYATPTLPMSNTVVLVDRPQAVQSVLNVMFPVDLKPGSPDAIKARVTNGILGGGTFRLFENLREKHGWTYGAYSALSSDKLIGNFRATAEVRTSVTDSAVTEIINEIKRIQTERVSDKELNMIKNYISGTFALALENPQTVATFAITLERYKLPKDYYDNYLKNLASITAEEVQATAKKYFRPENLYIQVVGKGEDVAEKLKKFSKEGKVNYYDVNGKLYDPNAKSKPAPKDVTPQIVIKKYVNAIGGAKKLSKMKDYTVKMSASMQGRTINFNTYRKAPNKYKMEIAMGPMVVQKVIYDGKAGITMNMQEGKKELKDKDLEEIKLQALMNIELSYDKLGIKQTITGIEEINGSDAYKIEMELPTGTKSTDYYDVKSGLKVKSVEGENGITEFGDYKEVDGIMFPYSIKQNMGPQSFSMKVESIEVNKKISDDVFKLE